MTIRSLILETVVVLFHHLRTRWKIRVYAFEDIDDYRCVTRSQGVFIRELITHQSHVPYFNIR